MRNPYFLDMKNIDFGIIWMARGVSVNTLRMMFRHLETRVREMRAEQA